LIGRNIAVNPEFEKPESIGTRRKETAQGEKGRLMGGKQAHEKIR